eukprot:2794063-Amphidinium_carterae.1
MWKRNLRPQRSATQPSKRARSTIRHAGARVLHESFAGICHEDPQRSRDIEKAMYSRSLLATWKEVVSKVIAPGTNWLPAGPVKEPPMVTDLVERGRASATACACRVSVRACVFASTIAAEMGQ